MFAHPRIKKSALQPPLKKRKVSYAVEEVTFDESARSDYLTGFHKRKLQRQKHAQQEAEKKARQEKLEMRKQLREERKQQVEEHVQQVEALLKEAERAGGVSEEESENEWEGISDPPALQPVDHEEEYIDEDKYTSVTVESVSVTRDGLVKPDEETSGDEENKTGADEIQQRADKGKLAQPKKRKQKFRYETKSERMLSQRKLKAKKRLKSRS